eukprot:9472500-Pyramimonas_sp.AAC.2
MRGAYERCIGRASGVRWVCIRPLLTTASKQRLGLHTDTGRPRITEDRIEFSSGQILKYRLKGSINSARLRQRFGVREYSGGELNSPV